MASEGVFKQNCSLEFKKSQKHNLDFYASATDWHPN